MVGVAHVWRQLDLVSLDTVELVSRILTRRR